jgi:membrane associated rhomboid family serine protease
MSVAPRSRRAWIVLGWMLVCSVVYLSLTPEPPAVDARHSDKFGHLAAYGALMAWWLQIDRNAYRLALIFILLGLLLEILQSLGGIRQGDIFDMAANALGVAIGWLIGRRGLHWSDRNLAA